MKATRIIEAKQWKNKKTGKTASIFGALPYYGNGDDWKIETVGYTVAWDTGQIGLFSRTPFKTLTEAKEAYPNVPVA